MKYRGLVCVVSLALFLCACSNTGTSSETVVENTINTTLNAVADVTNETETPTITTVVETTTTTMNSETTATTQTAADVDTLLTYLQTIAGAEPTTYTETNAVVPAEAKAAYQKYLDNMDLVYGVLFEDLNADGLAEMIVGENPYGNTYIVCWENGEIKTCGTEVMSDWGGTWDVCVDGETHTILNCYAYGHTLGAAGYQEWYIYTFDGGSNIPTKKYSYLRDAYPGVVPDEERANMDNYYGDATLNGEAIDERTSNEILALLQQISQKYPTFAYTERYDADGNTTDAYTDYVAKYLS